LEVKVKVKMQNLVSCQGSMTIGQYYSCVLAAIFLVVQCLDTQEKSLPRFELEGVVVGQNKCRFCCSPECKELKSVSPMLISMSIPEIWSHKQKIATLSFKLEVKGQITRSFF